MTPARTAAALPADADLADPGPGDDDWRALFANARWIGWRLRGLVAGALLGCLGLFLLSIWLAGVPQPDVSWRVGPGGSIELMVSGPAGGPAVPRTLSAIRAGDGTEVPVDAGLMQRSARWWHDDDEAAATTAAQVALSRVLSDPSAELVFADGRAVPVPQAASGFAALGPMYWLLCGLALLLYLVALVVLLSRPTVRNALYALMSLTQVAHLMLLAAGSGNGLAPPPGLALWEREARMVLDLVAVAAVLQAASLHPTRLPGAAWIGGAGWAVAATLGVLLASHRLPQAWAWTQTVMLGVGLLVMALLAWSHRRTPHPFAVLLRRFTTLCTGLLALMTLAVVLTHPLPAVHRAVVSVGPVLFHALFAALLLLVPFLSRSQQVVREFALLASVSTVATAVDLVFVAVFSLGQFASLTLTLFLALGVYAGARQWMMNRLLGSSVVTTERLFEQLYRVSREVEARPKDVLQSLSGLLRELFEPLELVVHEQPLARARIAAQGSALLVPVPDLETEPRGGTVPSRTIAMRFAQRGRRLFTAEDARLGDRIVEQLRRAVAYDKAVEHGRSEERIRLAQDLHDDIGARLLTLMYKAQTPEMEDYVRHTLQDLKTLTRGLAASSHLLSEAAAEWKADLAQRLALAHIDLSWTMQLAEDVPLSVVQWSGLTRVLRELVSNVIAHAQATHVGIELGFADGRLDLLVADDGVGRHPHTWSHGLGLGGVRKRVKQLGGEVEWIELAPSGIACRVVIRDFMQRR